MLQALRRIDRDDPCGTGFQPVNCRRAIRGLEARATQRLLVGDGDPLRGALTEREQRRQSERSQSAAVNEATLAEIGKQFDEAQAALDSATDSRVAETKRALAEARKQLDEAIAAARAKREGADAGGGPPRRRIKDPVDGLEDRLAGLGDLVAKKISVTGTFNPLASAGTRRWRC